MHNLSSKYITIVLPYYRIFTHNNHKGRKQARMKGKKGQDRKKNKLLKIFSCTYTEILICTVGAQVHLLAH